MKVKTLIVLLIVWALALVANAQLPSVVKTTKTLPYNKLTFSAGPSGYFGDLNHYDNPKQMLNSRVSSGVSYQRSFSSFLKGGLFFDVTSISGNDFHSQNLNNYSRNLHFDSWIFQGGLSMSFYPTSRQTNFKRRERYAPYVSIGYSMARFYSSTKMIQAFGFERVALRKYGTEGQGHNPYYPEPYKNVCSVIPLGIGVEKRFTETINMGLQLTYNYCFSDYLDDVSGDYPNRLFITDPFSQVLSNRSGEVTSAINKKDRIAKLNRLLAKEGIGDDPYIYLGYLANNVGVPRGDNLNFDSFFHLRVTLSYVFPDKLKCTK